MSNRHVDRNIMLRKRVLHVFNTHIANGNAPAVGSIVGAYTRDPKTGCSVHGRAAVRMGHGNVRRLGPITITEELLA